MYVIGYEKETISGTGQNYRLKDIIVSCTDPTLNEGKGVW